jgi:hypothetical protein
LVAPSHLRSTDRDHTARQADRRRDHEPRHRDPSAARGLSDQRTFDWGAGMRLGIADHCDAAGHLTMAALGGEARCGLVTDAPLAITAFADLVFALASSIGTRGFYGVSGHAGIDIGRALALGHPCSAFSAIGPPKRGLNVLAAERRRDIACGWVRIVGFCGPLAFASTITGEPDVSNHSMGRREAVAITASFRGLGNESREFARDFLRQNVIHPSNRAIAANFAMHHEPTRQ